MATDLLGPVMADMLACAADALDPSPGRAALYPGGSVVWDSCDCDGQVWVRLISLTPTEIGQRPSSASPCGIVKWIATFGVGVVRCVASLDDQGNPPTAAALTADTQRMTADLAALSGAIQCCFPDLRALERVVPTRWDALGPQGGCAGGEWSVTAIVDNCRCL